MVRTRIYTLNLKIYKCNKTLEKLQGKYSRKKNYKKLSYSYNIDFILFDEKFKES